MGEMPIFQWNRFCIVSVKLLFYENPCYCFLTEIYEGPLVFALGLADMNTRVCANKNVTLEY